MNPYLMGVLFGDGTCNYSKSNRAYQVWIDQHIKNEDIAKKTKSLFIDSGFNVHYYYFLNKVRVRVYSKELYKLFKEMRLNPKDYFNNLSNHDKLEFIAGFFDAEGTVTDRYVMYNMEKKLLDVMKSFLEVSIKCYIYKFGKVYGLQIYRKNDMKKFKEIIPSIKINRSSLC